MKRTELPRRTDPIAAGGPQVQAAVAVRRAHYAEQFSAAIWIIAAWLIGTLVSELNVIGGEPLREVSTAEHFVAPESLLEQWKMRETEFAMTHSGIAAFDRVERDSRLRILIESMISDEENRASIETPNPGTPNPPTPSAADTKKIELAYEQGTDSQHDVDMDADADAAPQKTPTQFAWKAFPEGSIPGLVERVVHSFHELMTPVHVRSLASDEAVVSVGDSGLQSEPSVGFVDEDTQESTDSTDSLAGVVVEPAVAEPKQEAVQADVPEDPPHTILATDNTQIIRSRPQLLRVQEPSVMMPAPKTESTAASNEEAVPANLRSVDNAPLKTNLPETVIAETGNPAASRPETRLAAKWPFERTESANSTGVSLNVDNVDVRTVFEMLARGYQMNILVAPEVEGTVTANVEGLTPEQTLQGIVKMCDLSMQRDGDMIFIYTADRIPADARRLHVFPLDFARAEGIEPTVQGLLSPVGNAYTNTIDLADNMRTQESIVVIDIPSVIAEVESFILQADQAPRQVVIEAHVLEVELSDDMFHGVNFEAILGGDLTVGSFGLADNIASKANPLFYAEIDGSDVDALITLLETTTDSKTLASPRVQVINGQNARIQVGQQLGFTVATVTQTSTIQDIQFLETGVVLSVTPTISRDNRILMQVKPEVSDGEINPVTLLPEEETREVETSVLLDNHQGVIIGGLIQEKDRTVIKKLPWLGNVKHVGWLFQRREAVRSRSEIIIALVPHIVERGVQEERSVIDNERVSTPLLYGDLQRNCRPWEARLPDPVGDHQHLDVNRVNRILP